MPTDNTRPSPRDVHPLAAELAAHYRRVGLQGPILEIAAGRGRITNYFVDAHIPIVSTRDDASYTQLPGGRQCYAAAISTHGYLHGAIAKLRLGFADLRRVLRPDAVAYFTLGSMADTRYGLGVPVDEVTFTPGDGPEVGIPHAFFDRAGVIDVLAPAFVIEELTERNVDEVVGTWVHSQPSGIWHWFVRARRAA